MVNNQWNKLNRTINVLHFELKFSQDEFARKANICYTTLIKIETGVIKKPSVLVMAKIAKPLGVNIEELIK